MSNLPSGNAANVIIGPARLLIAPAGTTLPTLDGSVDPVTWDAAFKEVGYTEDGTVLAYNPTVKDVDVDEEMSAVKKILDAEKAMFSAKLSEATLVNFNNAISASTYAHTPASGGNPEFATLKLGSGALTEVIVGFEGLSPAGFQRIIVGFRAIASANISATMRRAEKVVVPVEFALLADSTRPAGQRLAIIYDKLANHS